MIYEIGIEEQVPILVKLTVMCSEQVFIKLGFNAPKCAISSRYISLVSDLQCLVPEEEIIISLILGTMAIVLATHGVRVIQLVLNYQSGGRQIRAKLAQGIVDGSASKPALRQDTGYMVEKTYHDIAPYLGALGAYLMPQ